jgi:hypothetical protein
LNEVMEKIWFKDLAYNGKRRGPSNGIMRTLLR